jgi:hypothetical protein
VFFQHPSLRSLSKNNRDDDNGNLNTVTDRVKDTVHVGNNKYTSLNSGHGLP